jgi:hypothetical protein
MIDNKNSHAGTLAAHKEPLLAVVFIAHMHIF